jgi:hypothetical protein
MKSEVKEKIKKKTSVKIKVNTVFLKFRESDGNTILIAIDDILASGNPIDSETDIEMELATNNLYRGDGTVIK